MNVLYTNTTNVPFPEGEVNKDTFVIAPYPYVNATIENAVTQLTAIYEAKHSGRHVTVIIPKLMELDRAVSDFRPSLEKTLRNLVEMEGVDVIAATSAPEEEVPVEYRNLFTPFNPALDQFAQKIEEKYEDPSTIDWENMWSPYDAFYERVNRRAEELGIPYSEALENFNNYLEKRLSGHTKVTDPIKRKITELLKDKRIFENVEFTYVENSEGFADLAKHPADKLKEKLEDERATGRANFSNFRTAVSAPGSMIPHEQYHASFNFVPDENEQMVVRALEKHVPILRRRLKK